MAENSILNDIKKAENDVYRQTARDWNHKDLVEDTFQKITAKLSKGIIPWADMGKTEFPKNAITGHDYKGVDALRLGIMKQDLAPDAPNSSWISWSQMEHDNYLKSEQYKQAQKMMGDEAPKPERMTLNKGSKGVTVEVIIDSEKNDEDKFVKLDKPKYFYPSLFHSSMFTNGPIPIPKVIADNVMKNIAPIEPQPQASVKQQIQLEIISQYMAAKTGHPELAFSNPEKAGEYLKCLNEHAKTFENDFIKTPEKVVNSAIKKANEIVNGNNKDNNKVVEATKDQQATR